MSDADGPNAVQPHGSPEGLQKAAQDVWTRVKFLWGALALIAGTILVAAFIWAHNALGALGVLGVVVLAAGAGVLLARKLLEY